MQVVEEELSVGKRKVATGGVRVTSRVVERPVQQTVTCARSRSRPSAGGATAS